MGLLETAKQDIQNFTSNLEGFGVEITLTAPTAEVAIVNGLHTKHHLGYNTEGVQVNTKNAHVSISEQLLVDAGYPVRSASGEVNLTGHLVDVKDSTGLVKNYVIREWFPDETIGLIVCILGDYE